MEYASAPQQSAHRPARRPHNAIRYMAGGAARHVWPEESGRGVDRDGVLTHSRPHRGPPRGGPGLRFLLPSARGKAAA